MTVVNKQLYILRNNPRRNQTMKFGQFIKYNKKYFSLKIMQKMRQGDKTPLFFEKALCELKASGLQLSSNIF